MSLVLAESRLFPDPFVEPQKLEESLSKLSDEELVDLGYTLQEDSWRTWLRQCCIAAILLERHEGWLKELSRRWGVVPTRVSEMASIWRKIVAPLSQAGEALPPLPPSFYHEALRAKDPVSAIRAAADAKAANPRFSTRQFRRAIACEKASEAELLVSCENCRHLQRLKNVPLTVVVEDARYSLSAEVTACRFKGLLGVRYESDLEFVAEDCPDYWAKA